MKPHETVNRLGIYFFYDKDGKVDDYVPYLLDDLKKSLGWLIIVCNEPLTAEGRARLSEYADNLIVRENRGLDVWAYKAAMEHMGWKKLEQFDEVVLLNSTIMGPVYPFDDMFESMKQRMLDFWGITKYGKESFDPFGCNPYGYIPEHIQSHFMVYRKSLVKSIEFQNYWNNMPSIESYQQSVGTHESVFTKYFEDKGFRWDVYIDTDDYKELTTYPLIFYPKELIQDKRCPIFKRRSFFQDYDYVITNTTGQAAYELYEYLKKSGIYDVRMIWQNLLRTCNQADIARNMQLNFVVPTESVSQKNTKIIENKKIALIMHLYFPDLVEQSLQWASAMPENVDVYITTNTVEKKQVIERVFKRMICNKLEVRVIENRGRDVSSLLIGVRDIVFNYDCACFVHDKKTAQLTPGSVGEGFAYKCFNNTLYNKDFVRNVIELFVTEPNLGILSPPAPNHGDFFPTLGNEWTTNFDNCVVLANKLGINVPMDSSKEHLAPLGTMFWFRPEALRPLFRYNWNYEDFPQEPNVVDGSILHAIERLYPFAAQESGFYPGMLMSDLYAKIEITNLNYYVRSYNKVLIENKIQNYNFKMREDLSNILVNENQRVQEMASLLELLAHKSKALEKQVEELMPQTSLKFQLKDRISRFFKIKSTR